MKITFQNQEYINNDLQFSNQSKKTSEKLAMEKNTSAASFVGSVQSINNNNLFDQNEEKKKGKTLTELQQEAGNIDVGVSQDYMTVLSNTLSKEDYEKAQKEGFDYREMDYQDVVTIQDKIKVEMAKSGEVIVGYNDDLSSAQLSKLLGNEGLAQDLEKAFSQADIPFTKENMDDLQKAWEYASLLETPSQEATAYMIQNEMKPSIWNFYLAENSGADSNNPFAEKQNNIDLSDASNSKLLEQITNMLKMAGYQSQSDESNNIDDALEKAQWLLDRELPVSADSVKNLEGIESVSFPISSEKFAKAAANSISKGISPIYADLTEGESIYEKAAKVSEKYFSAEMWNSTVGDITARRQLEEIRLSMTAEVNLKLIESGFSIDTAPMEELISALKEAEKQVALKYFPEFSNSPDSAVSSYRLMNDVNDKVTELASYPAASLGMFTSRSAEEISLADFHTEGAKLKDTYEKAGESYEALMTAPRADLGDSIKKAFANIEDLAKENEIKINDENLRAIRILGYNHMEINQDNVDKVVAADVEVQGLIRKMTPSSVLEMIRDGVNPLEKSFAELNEYFDEQSKEGFEKQSKDYSEFLYGLERIDGITEEERESFIGIYRMIHQVESLDSAAVGSVLNMNTELDFKNLLAAVRIRKLHGLDVTMDKNYGTASEIIRDSLTITEQIATAFSSERYAQEVEELREAAKVSKEAVMMAERFDITQSANNLLAMEELLSMDSNLFEELSKTEKGKAKVKEEAKNIDEALSEDNFEEKYGQMNEELGTLSEELTVEAEKYIDVKALSLIHRQLSISKSISEKNDITKEQEYVIPMEIGDTVSKVHLSFVNGEGETSISIKVALNEEENVEAYFELRNAMLEGYLVGNTENELKKMETISDIFDVAITNNDSLKGLEAKKMPVVNRESDRPISNKTENNRGKDAKVLHSDGSEKKVLLQITKVFLQSVREA